MCRWFLEMSPRSRNEKQEELSSITALVPSVGTRHNPQRNCMDHASQLPGQARALVHQLSSHSAGSRSQPEKLLQSGKCSSGPRRKPWDKARETLRHACDGVLPARRWLCTTGTPKSPEGHREVTPVREHACYCPSQTSPNVAPATSPSPSQKWL